jgi:hypothetical protein
MTDSDKQHKRTAVLVVHGIGSQRALETVRGVIKGVWLDSENPYDAGRRIWSHPERDGADIDLTVMTTNEVPKSKDDRSVDFHELYWAHLMSETKPVAVLLWLYELCRKGPIMKKGINGLWWAAAIFLCLMNLSVAALVLRGAVMFAKTSAQNLLIPPFLLLSICIAFGILIAAKWWAFRLIRALAGFLVVGAIVSGIYFLAELYPLWKSTEQVPDVAELVTIVALPTLIALLGTRLLMGEQGLRAFWIALLISLAIAAIFVGVDQFWSPKKDIFHSVVKAWPWALNAPWSVPIAFAILGLYLIANAAFLQPYLGDAARYFRGSPANVAVRRAIRTEAVNSLHNLHKSCSYDRIIVVAHSLGTVVAYDMLRAYFSRICSDLPPVANLGSEFAEIDAAAFQPNGSASADDMKILRQKARLAVTSIAAAVEEPGDKPTSWLVTDLVTLGSALTHAYFLMCLNKKDAEIDDDIKAEVSAAIETDPKDDVEFGLKCDFARRVREREFPTCPPKRLDKDGLLTFRNPKTGLKQVHHGALFGLTRWTNIFFPMVQIFWGDAIGGRLAPIFGSHVVDYPVSTHQSGDPDFFTHTVYWDVCREPDKFKAPHIVALRDAIDLADIDTAISVVDDALASNARKWVT